MFGVHLEKGENRFHSMSRLYPRKWNYDIMVLKRGEVLGWYGVDFGRDDNDSVNSCKSSNGSRLRSLSTAY